MVKPDKIVLPPGTRVPDHVALVMDGNRRWARARGLDTLQGHKAGFDRAVTLARLARDTGVHTISLWGWSTENWDRTQREIDYLMLLHRRMLKKYLKEAMEEEVKLVHLGRKDRMPKELIRELAQAEEKTKHFSKHIVNICLDYGGRDEIARAVNRYVEAGDRRPMDEDVMKEYLDTHDQPYPYVDLFIRTSGEQRGSGFMLWQAAYAEVYWELDHLPDFTPEKFKEAILDYSRRRRRFGANDEEEHLKFNPKLMAGFEVQWHKNLSREAVTNYVKEQYGLSKQLARDAGTHMYNALRFGEQKEWMSAKESLTGLYEVVKHNLGLAFEPEIIANFEVELWKSPATSSGQVERAWKEYLAEKFRISEFQAAKSAHLAYLAHGEIAKKNFEGAKNYLEKFYRALKERVA